MYEIIKIFYHFYKYVSAIKVIPMEAITGNTSPPRIQAAIPAASTPKSPAAGRVGKVRITPGNIKAPSAAIGISVRKSFRKGGSSFVFRSRNGSSLGKIVAAEALSMYNRMDILILPPHPVLFCFLTRHR